MKKLIVSLIFSVLIVFCFSGSAKAEVVNIGGYDVDMDVILAEDSRLWILLADFERPNDPESECLTKTIAFANANTAYLQDVFPWLWEPGQDVSIGSGLFCAVMQEIPNIVEEQMIDAQLFVNGSQTTDIFDPVVTPNWHNVNNLVIDHPYGTIEFTGTIDFLSYDFVNLALSFSQAFTMNPAYVSLDSELINGLKSMGAVITMKNVPDFENPVILINGKEDINGLISDLVYDKEAKTITFTTGHFTSFEAVEDPVDEIIEDPIQEEVEEDCDCDGRAKIYSWKAEKYMTQTKDLKIKVRLKIKGKRFCDDTEVKIGNEKADRIKIVSSRKMYAWFDLEDLQKKYDPERKIRVKNPDTKERTADDELDVRYIAWRIRK